MYFANKTQKIFVWSPFPLMCETVLIQEKGEMSSTYSSVTSLGIPLGKVFKALLLHRTTVSKQVHSAGQRASGEQLLSSFPKLPKDS